MWKADDIRFLTIGMCFFAETICIWISNGGPEPLENARIQIFTYLDRVCDGAKIRYACRRKFELAGEVVLARLCAVLGDDGLN